MDALRTVEPETAEETARRISKLADGNPEFLNIQVVAANVLANQGLFEEALRIARESNERTVMARVLIDHHEVLWESELA